MDPSSFGTQAESSGNLDDYGREWFNPAYRDEWSGFVLHDRISGDRSGDLMPEFPEAEVGSYRCATDLE